MILAAGRGVRMRPLTDLTPKPLLAVGGKPLLFRHLENLSHAGFEAVTINHAHLGEQIEAAVGDGSRWNLEVRYSPEAEALETAGGIRNALPLIGGSFFAVINGDVYSDYDYSGLAAAVEKLADTHALAHLVMVDNPVYHRSGDFYLESGLVRASGRQRLTFSGLGAYRAELFEPLARGARQPLAPLLREQLPKGTITGEHYRGLWSDVGTPGRLAELNAQLQRGTPT